MRAAGQRIGVVGAIATSLDFFIETMLRRAWCRLFPSAWPQIKRHNIDLNIRAPLSTPFI